MPLIPARFRTRPELLLHPQIPKPMHGVSPRVVMGQEWWDQQRQGAYAKYGFRCWACGVHKAKAEVHQWLEGHECYDIDYRRGRMVLIEVVALCHLCHNFIHQGRLSMLVRDGEATEEFAKRVIKHGRRVLGRMRPKPSPTSTASWGRWRLVIDGKEYGPSTKGLNAWMRGEWKNWRPS